MKITEVRNNLFELSDLKGLIKENMFDEAGLGRAGLDWGGYFSDNPERLKLSFIQAMGLPKVPKTPLTIEDFEAMGGGESEIRKYFGDEEFASILSNPINFIKDQGYKNIYDVRLKNYRKKFNYNQQPKTTQVLDTLRELFFKNGGNEISKTTAPTPAYFELIMVVSQKAIYEAISNGFKDFSDTYVESNGQQATLDIGNIYDPFLFFLFLYYVTYFSRGSGQADYVKNKQNQYKTKVLNNYPEYAEIISWVLEQMEGGLTKNQTGSENIISSLSRIFLNPVGLSFMGEMSEEIPSLLYNGGKLYNVLITNGPKFIETISTKEINEYKNTVGGFLLKVLYLFGLSATKTSGEIKAIFDDFIPGKENELIRGAIYRARYNSFFNRNKDRQTISSIISIVSDGFGVGNQDAIFDQFYNPSIVKIRNAGLHAKGAGFTFEIIGGLELPEYENEENLTPFEAVVLFSRNVERLLSKQAVDYYGGNNIINEGTLFLPAGNGLNLLYGIEKKDKKFKERYQRIENLYKAEDASEEWSFYDLLANDFLGGDKTQKAIFYFLKTHTKPGTADWIYEYNRKTQEDRELDKKSIDILCKYGGNTAVFEYQGEQHFRPYGITPKDEIEDAATSPNVKIFNDLKNEILNEYIKEHNKKAEKDPNFKNKWSVAEIYEPIMLKAYENSFEKLVGSKFIDIYNREMQRSGYLRSMPSYKKVVTESKFDRQRDITDIIRYEFCLLCYWRKLPLPEEFITYTGNKDIFKQPKMGTDIIYLGSPWRFKEELHVYFGKISDRDKAELIKKRGWPAAYILPKISKVSSDDVALTKEFANPPGAVFEWSDKGKQKILDFAKRIGIQIEEESKDNALFEEIIKEFFNEYNPQ